VRIKKFEDLKVESILPNANG